MKSDNGNCDLDANLTYSATIWPRLQQFQPMAKKWHVTLGVLQTPVHRVKGPGIYTVTGRYKVKTWLSRSL